MSPPKAGQLRPRHCSNQGKATLHPRDALLKLWTWSSIHTPQFPQPTRKGLHPAELSRGPRTNPCQLGRRSPSSCSPP